MISKPSKRLKANQVLEHPWMKSEIKQEVANLKLNWNTLKQFQNHQKLKKVALTYIASQLSDNEISELGKLFKSLDKNGDGVLTVEEIKAGIYFKYLKKTSPITFFIKGVADKGTGVIKDIEQVLSSIDTDGSGTINYTEFLAATIESNVYMKEEKLYMAFRMLDIDGSGKISPQELKQILGSNFK